MGQRRVIMWIFFYVLLISSISTGVKAQELTEVSALDILDQIEKGEDVDLEKVRIIGELNLSKIELKTVPVFYLGGKGELKVIETEIKITNSVFVNDVDFLKTQFNKPVSFFDTSFSGKSNFFLTNFVDNAYFDYTNFSGDTSFTFSTFSGDASFSSASFVSNTDFNYTNFGGFTDFDYTSFDGNVDFKSTRFSGITSFTNANFSSITSFSDAIFSDNAYFKYSNFSDDTDFEAANFVGNAHFEAVNFGGITSFSDANFDNNAYFKDSSFGDDTDFVAASFGDEVSFWNACFRNNTRFEKTRFNEVIFIDTSFSNVSLTNTDFERMRVDWSSLKNTLAYNGEAYIKLIKNFKEMEQFEDADNAYYQYRRVSQRNNNIGFSWLGDVITWITCGYGVRPFNSILFGGLLIFLFSIIYYYGDGISRLKEKEDDDAQKVSMWDALYFSMVTFTTIGYGDWYPKNRFYKYVVIEGLVGWLTLALFLVTLANVMIRP